jgi:hypothetical protein|eukprot:COSAG01_NODE_7983_length_2965_cov_3.456036_1_plen_89_part_00
MTSRPYTAAFRTERIATTTGPRRGAVPQLVVRVSTGSQRFQGLAWPWGTTAYKLVHIDRLSALTIAKHSSRTMYAMWNSQCLRRFRWR